MANSVEFLIKARDLTASAVNKIIGRFNKMRQSVNNSFKSMLKSVFSLRSGLILLTAAAVGLGKAIGVSFQFEKFETQFEVLLGSIDAAKERMVDLANFAATTPFQLEGIATASRLLETFSGGALGGIESLKLIGDAAAGTSNEIEETAFWVGRLFSSLQAGKPFGEAAARLSEMAILSGEARNKMEDLQKAGASQIEIWRVLQEELKKNAGGMAKLSVTGSGLISTLKDNWMFALKEFGDVFQDLSKDKIKGLIDTIKDLKDSGAIQQFAKDALNALELLGKGIGFISAVFAQLRRNVEMKAEFLGTIVGGGSIGDAFASIGSTQRGRDAAALDFRIEARRAQLAKRSEETIAPVKKSLEEKVIEALGKADERMAKKVAKVKEKEAEKLFKKQEVAAKKLVELEFKDRLGMLKRLEKESRKETKAAERGLKGAERRSAQAFEEFLDPEKLRSRLAEEAAREDAEKRFQRQVGELGFLKGATGANLANLSLQDQAVARLFQAREAEEAARAAVIETQKNTKRIADSIEAAINVPSA